VAVIGGLGFLGQNLVNSLDKLGAHITLVDRNIQLGSAKSKLNKEIINRSRKVVSTDITLNQKPLKKIIKSNEIIINLIAFLGSDVNQSLRINFIFHLNFLERCKKLKTDSVILYPSTRLVYGLQKAMPVKEDVPLQPNTLYGINKLLAERYYNYYAQNYGLKTVCLRISNPYGPQNDFNQAKNVLNSLIFKSYRGGKITIFGDGSQFKDAIFINDLSDGLLKSATVPSCYGKIFNLGSGEIRSFKSIVQKIVQVINHHSSFEHKKLSINDPSFVADISKIQKFCGWRPTTNLEKGLKLTNDFLEGCYE